MRRRITKGLAVLALVAAASAAAKTFCGAYHPLLGTCTFVLGHPGPHNWE